MAVYINYLEGEMSEQKDSPTESKADVKPANMAGFTILQIITWTNAEIAKCREKLEVEPSGRVVAYLQGKIPGCKFAIKNIREIFGLTDEQFAKLEAPVVICSLSMEQILGAEIDMEQLKENELWGQFISAINQRAEEMKDFLLKRAKKSRELDEYQGEYQGMMHFEKVFESIREQCSYWKHPLFKKDDEEGSDANDQDPALLPPGLPPPEEDYPPQEDYEELGERDSDDSDDEEDPDVDMDSDED